MITAGYLNSDGTAASGITYLYDNCSQTVCSLTNFRINVTAFAHKFTQPFVYNSTSGVVISYDDATSFGMSFFDDPVVP
jgi:chitinase